MKNILILFILFPFISFGQGIKFSSLPTTNPDTTSYIIGIKNVGGNFINYKFPFTYFSGGSEGLNDVLTNNPNSNQTIFLGKMTGLHPYSSFIFGVNLRDSSGFVQTSDSGNTNVSALTPYNIFITGVTSSSKIYDSAIVINGAVIYAQPSSTSTDTIQTGLSGQFALTNQIPTAGAGLSGTSVLSITPTGVTSGSYGSYSVIPGFTVNTMGQITGVTNYTVSSSSSIPTIQQVLTSGSVYSSGGYTINFVPGGIELGNSLSNSLILEPTSIGFLGNGGTNEVTTQLVGVPTVNTTVSIPVNTSGTYALTNQVGYINGYSRLTAQTIATTIATCSVGASDGSFIVSANINVTTSTTHAFTVTCTYTNESNNSVVLTEAFTQVTGSTLLTSITNVTGAGSYEGITFHIRAKAGTSITWATTGTFTSVTYNCEGLMTKYN